MKIHLIAIGGAVMHNLALELQELGCQVTGSDDQIWDPTKSRLANAGLLPSQMGWFPEKITQDMDMVILGMHAKSDNPELLQAKNLNIKILSFPEFIFEHAQHKQRIVVAGSHGKTTTTAILLHVLKENQIKFDYLVGSSVSGFSNMVHLSKEAPILVAEGDEYLASPLLPVPKFLVYQPHIVVLTGIAWDHINVFESEEVYYQQFEKLLLLLPKAGTVIYNSEDSKVVNLVSRCVKPDIHYAIPYETAMFKYKSTYTEYRLAGEKGTTQLFGKHNFSNISAAWQVCRILGLSATQFIQPMINFQSPDKRMQTTVTEKNGILIQDFAHAPSKAKATVEAVSSRFEKKEVIACLELHTFSSLNTQFLPQYADSLSAAKQKIIFVNDQIVEKKGLSRLNDEVIQQAFQDNNITILRTKQALIETLKPMTNQKTVLLMMSSGDFGGLKLTDLVS